LTYCVAPHRETPICNTRSQRQGSSNLTFNLWTHAVTQWHALVVDRYTRWFAVYSVE